jgi:hypothetical protein
VARRSTAGLKDDLKSLMDIPEVDAVLLFGSQASGANSERSDTDICVVATEISSPREMSKLLGRIWGQTRTDSLDIWLFEELPLYIQIEVIHTHEVLHCRDLPELYEYFYWKRKEWEVQSGRQELSFLE